MNRDERLMLAMVMIAIVVFANDLRFQGGVMLPLIQYAVLWLHGV